jgi:outer membrane receptor for ferrienterochelin and colicin
MIVTNKTKPFHDGFAQLRRKLFMLSLVAATLLINNNSNAQPPNETKASLFHMKLEELMTVGIRINSLRDFNFSEQPVQLRIIDRATLDSTPDYTLPLLLTTVIPEAVFRTTKTQNTGLLSFMGMRNQFLLLVNCQSFSGKPTFMTETKMNNWTVKNLHAIEILHFPQAFLNDRKTFTGVINIITREAEPFPKAETTLEYNAISRLKQLFTQQADNRQANDASSKKLNGRAAAH